MQNVNYNGHFVVCGLQQHDDNRQLHSYITNQHKLHGVAMSPYTHIRQVSKDLPNVKLDAVSILKLIDAVPSMP